jgi:hypothetical protein
MNRAWARSNVLFGVQFLDADQGSILCMPNDTRLPVWVIRVDFGMSASCPVWGVISENAGCPVLPVEGVGLDVIQAPMAFKAERAEVRTAAE